MQLDHRPPKSEGEALLRHEAEFEHTIFAIATIIAQKGIQVFIVDRPALSTLISIFVVVTTNAVLVGDVAATPRTL